MRDVKLKGLDVGVGLCGGGEGDVIGGGNVSTAGGM